MKHDALLRRVGGWLFMLFALPSAAADLTVKVLDHLGAPASNAVVLVHTVAGAPHPPPITVEVRQARLRFTPSVQVVPVGSTVSFANEDNFDHHVRGQSRHRQFEFMVPAQANAAAKTPRSRRAQEHRVVLNRPDIVQLTCHLHSSMFAHIVVTDAPYFAVTNDRGEVAFSGVGEGTAKISVWHALQLTEIAPIEVQLSQRALYVPLRLNVALPHRN
jgi:plastocyanin